MKNRQAIILLFVANFISGVAQGITMIAIPWHFAKIDSMSLFGVFYMTSNIISLFWSPYAGTLIDRYNRKNIFMYICFVVGGIEMIILTIGWNQGNVSILGIGIIFILTLLNYNIHYNNLYAFSQEIVEETHFKKITSYLEIASQAATMLSGAAAAFLLDGSSPTSLIQINAWTIEEFFLADVITYFIALIIIYFINYQKIIHNEIDKSSLIERIKSGYHYLKSQKNMLWFGVLSLNTFATFMVFIFTGSAMYVKNILNEGGDTYSLVDVCYGIGAGFAGIAIQRIFSKIDAQKSVMVMTLLTASVYLLMWCFPSKYIYLFLIFVIGITNAGIRVQRLVYIFQNVDNQYFGRINSVFSLFNMTIRIIFIGVISMPFFINEKVMNIFPVFIIFLLISVYLLNKYYVVKNQNTTFTSILNNE